MGKRVVELTGDVTPDAKALQEADILVTTPEKWTASRAPGSATGTPVRIVGLSTALATRRTSPTARNRRVACTTSGPSGRHPMDVHIQGFPGKHYCPRMATMNKPV
ncbi:hypothetical protein FNF31_08019 [Cafeteria roenbergensis]|uniref:Uncharacterized protein n=1 Tax=Cafeteria roenbergensis TaxID=33653 RepID=A0A5A8BYR6_CAFRO|nr:hypothetical protein FNF31_08019 [Cafeteria roenbergensis]